MKKLLLLYLCASVAFATLDYDDYVDGPGHVLPLHGSPAKCIGLCDYRRHHTRRLIGAYVPQCDAYGNFLPQQCHGSTGYCWCVNVVTGEEIPNTSTPAGTPPVDCGAGNLQAKATDGLDPVSNSSGSAVLAMGHVLPLHGSPSKCIGLCDYRRQHTQPHIGASVPQCDAYGNFLPQQCHSSTGYCWCVNVVTGEEIPHTRTPPRTPPVDCGAVNPQAKATDGPGHVLLLHGSPTKCIGLCDYRRHHTRRLIGTYVPQCDAYGNFLLQQCHVSIGICWCVNVVTGEEIPNTSTPAGSPPVDCGAVNLQAKATDGPDPVSNSSGSAVLAMGHVLPLHGSPSKCIGLCDYRRHHTQPHIGASVPQCDAYGNFLPQQCHGSTGYFWCVNIVTGEEITHTRTPPGTPPVDCGAVNPQAKATDGPDHVLSLHGSPAKCIGLCDYRRQHTRRLIGTYVPQCDAYGNFLSQQCHSSTGICWCVNVVTGEEIPNTSTPAGTPPVDCGGVNPQAKANDGPDPVSNTSGSAVLAMGHVLPLHGSPSKCIGLCDYRRQHTQPRIGVSVPQCDAYGNFLPQQCHGSTGYCWCVNVVTGEEIPHTRTPPGTPPVDCGAGNPQAKATARVDARGHRPLQMGRESYRNSRYSPPPIAGSSRYRGRPSTPQVGTPQVDEKVEQPEAGGCTHASEEMGVLCPNGCELKTMLVKQERSVKTSISELKPQVDDLMQSSNNVYTYVKHMSNSLRERQRAIDNNQDTVSQYTDRVEEQHAFIKETVNTVFPSNIRVLQSVLEKIKLKIQKLERAIQAQTEDCREPCQTKCPIPVVSGKECEDIFRRGGRDSQMYLIQPDPFLPPYKVYCDQESNHGGWLVVQNRLDGSVDFGRRWDEYRRGFGNVAFDVGRGHCQTPGEYWLGNDRISQLTKMGPTQVLIEMEDWTGAKVHAQYEQFTIQSETSNYVMAVDSYSGTAGNCFLDGSLELTGVNRTMTIHNGMMFSTYDRDNDNWNPGDPSKQCSREDGGGWWYNRCHSANPNGRYYIGGSYSRHMTKHGTDDGVVWMNWKGSWYSLKAISMKIRPFLASR